MSLGAIIGGATSLIGASSAKSAANDQKQAAEDQLALSEKMYDTQIDMYEPYRDAGVNALSALNYELGLGPKPTYGGTAPTIETINVASPAIRPTPGGNSGGMVPNALSGQFGEMFAENPEALAHLQRANPNFYGDPGSNTALGGLQQFSVNGKVFNSYEDAQAYANANMTGGSEYEGFTGTPGYDFRLQEGYDSINASVGARHGLISGAAEEARLQYGQDYASNEYNNYLNNLKSQVGVGQSSVAGAAAAGTNYTTAANTAFANYGDAGAAGSIGVGNAITGGINNGLSTWAYGKESGLF